MKSLWYALSALFLCGCGYHFEGTGQQAARSSISVPYITSDPEGNLNNALAREISRSGVYTYQANGGDLTLQVQFISDGSEKVGWRYDRDDTSGELRHNLVGTENRRVVTVQVTLTDTATGEACFEPFNITAAADYDYVDPSSLRDLSFIRDGHRIKVINFSMGQLDSVEGGHDDASTPVFRHLAQKIVDAVISQQW